MNTFTFCFFLFSLKPLAGWIFGGLGKLEPQLAYLIAFAQFLLKSALHFTSWHSILVLYYIRITFFKNIFLFPGHVPTTAHLMVQHTSHEHQMTLYRESGETKGHVPLLGVGIIK